MVGFLVWDCALTAEPDSFQAFDPRAGQLMAPGIEHDGDHNDHAGDDTFGGFGGAHLRQSSFEGSYNQHAKKSIHD